MQSRPVTRRPRAALVLHLLVLARLAIPGWAATAAAPAGPVFEGKSVFRAYGEEDGLGSPTVTVLFQDRAGFLWVGTWEGLFRFDGRRFARFDRDDGLPSASVTAIGQRKDGRLYVGTRRGLARWNGTGFVALGKKEGLPEDAAVMPGGIASDASGTLLVGTARGLYQSISEIFALDGRRDGPEVPVSWLDVAADGTLSYARGHLLYRRENGATREAGSRLGLPPLERIDALRSGADGALWLRTPDRLFVLAKGSARFDDVTAGLPPSSGIGGLSFDSAGRLLVPTLRGLAIRSETGWTAVGTREGLEIETVSAALEDREQGLWLGLPGIGLVVRLGRGRVSAWDRSVGLPDDTVWAVTRERAAAREGAAPEGIGPGGGGALWVGTQGGLARLAPDGSVRTVLPGVPVFALAAGPDGSIWAGAAPGGVLRIAGPGAPRAVPLAGVAARDARVWALHVRADGEVWAGTSDGVYRLPPRAASFERVVLPEKFEGDAVFGLAEDGNGTVWGAGRFGLIRLTGSAIQRFGKRQGLASDFLSSVLALPDGRLAVSYREAPGADLVRVERGRLTVTALDPATSSAARRIVFLGLDASGAIWTGGAGVDVFREGKEPIRFGHSDGLVSRDVTQNSFYAEGDGTVWFGTNRGLVRIRPSPEPPHPPLTTVILGARAGSRALPTDGSASLLPGERDLSLSWAGLSFAHAERMRYRYTVTGLSGGAVETTASEATLAGLRAGSYRFEVAAIPAPGTPPGPPAVFSFTVEPLLLESWWTRGLLLLLAGTGAVLLFRARTRAVAAERDALRAALERKEAELVQAGRRLEEAAITDALTGIRTRHFLSAAIQPEVERALRAHATFATAGERSGGGLLFVRIDLDGLDALDARLGDPAGDAVLVETARRLKAVVRASDFLVRWDRAGFLVVTRLTDRSGGSVVARKLLGAVRGEPVPLPEGGPHRQTASIGWTPFPWFVDAPSAIPFETLLAAAGLASAKAKTRGGDRAIGLVPGGVSGAGAPEAREALSAPFSAPGAGAVEVVETGPAG